MGAWGAGIFDSDSALDIEAEFRDMMGEGVGVDDAVNKLIEDWDPENEIEDEGAEFWLALAAVQVKTGRLTEMVKKRALEIIESGMGIAGFERDCPELVPARKRAIKRLEKRIRGPQKKPTKIKKPFVEEIEWEVGDGLAYQLPSGKWTGLKFVHISYRTKSPESTYQVLDLYQDQQPTPDEMRNAEPHIDLHAAERHQRFIERISEFADRMSGRHTNGESKEEYLQRQSQIQMEHTIRFSYIDLSKCSKQEKPPGALVHVVSGLQFELPKNFCGGVCFGGWRDIDKYLERTRGMV
tara:strand:+ start:98 stop:985 length:888 start_codon:yes stop_codon:yes gene_type:complete